jgi:hypothetical protein
VVHASDDPHPRRHPYTCARNTTTRARRSSRRRRSVVARARAPARHGGEPRVADIYGRRRRDRRGGDRAHVAGMKYAREFSFFLGSFRYGGVCILFLMTFVIGRRVASLRQQSSVASPCCVVHVSSRFRSGVSPDDGACIVLFDYPRSRAQVHHFASPRSVLRCSGFKQRSGMRAAILARLRYSTTSTTTPTTTTRADTLPVARPMRHTEFSR